MSATRESLLEGGAGSPSRPEFQRDVGASGPETQARSESGPHRQAKPSRLWLWFVAAFVVQAAMWIAWFIIAAHNQVQEIPLVSGGH